LQHEEYWTHGSGVGAYLEVETNRSNIYKPIDSLFAGDPPDLRPEEKSGQWVRFEVRADEKPVELRDYEAFNDELQIAYIWKVE